MRVAERDISGVTADLPYTKLVDRYALLLVERCMGELIQVHTLHLIPPVQDTTLRPRRHRVVRLVMHVIRLNGRDRQDMQGPYCTT